MKKIEHLLNDGSIIIVPSELKTFLLEIKSDNPFLNFKLFTLNELFKELHGNYFDTKVINLGFRHFPDLTYSAIKEVTEMIFKTFEIEKSNDSKLIEFSKALKDEGLLIDNDDLRLLLQNREVIFINFEDSTLVKKLIEHVNIKNYKFIPLTDILMSSKSPSYHAFFNIADETRYFLNEMLNEVNDEKNPGEIEVICDTERFDYYLNLLLADVDVPYDFRNSGTLIDTKTYKFIYNYLDDQNVSLIKLLVDNKNEINDENIDEILTLLTSFNIDSLKNRRINVNEILGSRLKKKDNIKNSIKIGSGITFSKNKSIYLLGLDDKFLPKAKKDNKVYTYAFKNSIGLDSLDETNLMKSKLETAFLLQPSIKFISFHNKDNQGKYSKSYYIESLGMEKVKNELQKFEYSENTIKFTYRNEYDKFLRTGAYNDKLLACKEFYENKIAETYDPKFKGLEKFNYDPTFKYSFSSLSTFNECYFKFFVKYWLKDSSFDETFYTKIGNIAHEILTHIYEDEFNFEDSLKEVLKNNNLEITKRERALLKRFFFEVERTCNFILEHRKNMSLVETYNEKSLYVDVSYYDKRIVNKDGKEELEEVKDLIHVYGRIDRMIKTSDDSLYIIDYKTGNAEFKKNSFFKYNESLQLPFYLFLANHCNNEIIRDSYVSGLFIQPLIMGNQKFFNLYAPSEEDIKSIYLNGVVLNDIDRYRNFDYSLNLDDAKESKYILGAKISGKGKKQKFNGRSSGVVSSQDLEVTDKQVNDFIIDSIIKIKHGYFPIESLSHRYSSSSLAGRCKFCEVKDVCMKVINNSEDNEDGE